MTLKHARPRLATVGAVGGVVPDQCHDDQDITPEPTKIDEAITLAATLRELVAILTALRATLDRQTTAGLVEPLLDRSDLATVLRCSLVTIDRLKAAGKLPRPDLIIGGRSPRWRVSTVRAYLEKGGRS
jgi:predicted DNA-binding transcriptional regulator AlpA